MLQFRITQTNCVCANFKMFKQNENGRYNMVVMVNSNKHEIFLYNKCLTVNIQVQTN